MTAATARSAPFDARYMYLSGPFADGDGPCASCLTGCTAEGAQCDNAHGCGWWGCWQWDQDPPGAYVRQFVRDCRANTYAGAPRPLVPVITYYLQFQNSGLAEGTTQLAALNDVTRLRRYFNDWRFVVQQVGSSVALLHLEPDLWGYVQHAALLGQQHSPPVAQAQTRTASRPADNRVIRRMKDK